MKNFLSFIVGVVVVRNLVSTVRVNAGDNLRTMNVVGRDRTYIVCLAQHAAHAPTAIQDVARLGAIVEAGSPIAVAIVDVLHGEGGGDAFDGDVAEEGDLGFDLLG